MLVEWLWLAGHLGRLQSTLAAVAEVECLLSPLPLLLLQLQEEVGHQC